MTLHLQPEAHQLADDGQPVFYGCVKPMLDGSLRLIVMVTEGSPDNETKWSVIDLRGPEAAEAAMELELLVRGGRA